MKLASKLLITCTSLAVFSTHSSSLGDNYSAQDLNREYAMIRRANLAWAREMVEQGNVDAVGPENYTSTPLNIALCFNDNALVLRCIEKKAKVTFENLREATLYHHNLDTMKLLLENGGREATSESDEFGYTILHNLESYDEKMVELLLANGAQAVINKPYSIGWTPLMSNMRDTFFLNGTYERCVCLINHGASVALHSKSGFSPLQFAVEQKIQKKYGLVSLCLQKGAWPTINLKQTQGPAEEQTTPLQLTRKDPETLALFTNYLVTPLVVGDVRHGEPFKAAINRAHVAREVTEGLELPWHVIPSEYQEQQNGQRRKIATEEDIEWFKTTPKTPRPLKELAALRWAELEKESQPID